MLDNIEGTYDNVYMITVNNSNNTKVQSMNALKLNNNSNNVFLDGSILVKNNDNKLISQTKMNLTMPNNYSYINLKGCDKVFCILNQVKDKLIEKRDNYEHTK